MNSKPVKRASLAMIFTGVLMLLGFGGFVNPAFAADEIFINDDDAVTNYHQVVLSITPPAGSVTMSFRNNSNPQWSADEDATGTAPITKPWSLVAPDGVKTVLVQFKDGAGTILGIYSDTIRLDYIIDTNFFSPNGSTNYGNPGQYKTAGHAIAVQSDQKIVVVGTVDNGSGNSQLQVIRYNPDGSYDPDFGAGSGMVYYGNATGVYSGNAVAVHPITGKIVVTGTYDFEDGTTGLWLLQLMPDGSQDPDFNPDWGGGYLVLGGDGSSSGNAVTIDELGRTVVVGTYGYDGSLESVPWVLRFDDLGNPDTTFNGTGEVVVTASYGAHKGNGVAIDSTGNIVVVGTYDNDDGTSSVWAMRLTDAGELDTAFGEWGTGETTFGSDGLHTGNAVAIDPDSGMIAVVGTFDWTGGNTDVWLLRLDNDGLLDSGFNPNPIGIPPGTVALGGDGADSGSAVIIQPDGKIVVAGSYDNGTVTIINDATIPNTSLLVQRINADGSYDLNFNKGDFNYSFGTSAPFTGRGVALQADQMIVVTGKGYGKDTNNVPLSSILTLRLNGVTWPLTITTTGSGTVAALPGDIAWVGSTGIGGNYIPGTEVQLVATPTGNASFTGWSGCDSYGGSGTPQEICIVTMDAARAVQAGFSLPVTLNVTVLGNGSGFVTSSPLEGIYCPGGPVGSCSNPNITIGSTVTLTATPGNWYTTFSGWSEAAAGCGTSSTCDVLMDATKNVSATFDTNNSVKITVSGKSSYQPTLGQAYVKMKTPTVPATATMTAQTMYYPEQVTLDVPVALVFNGGKDTDFLTTTGYTSIKGPLIIQKGSMRVTYIKVLPL